MLEKVRNPKGTVTIGVVGKYVKHQDAYKSVREALCHAAHSEGYKIEIKWFEADQLPNGSVESAIKGCDGYLVPGGFGERGWMGKIMTAKYCRENKIPYFGICFGMHVMAVEFARHVLKLTDANTTEVDPDTKNPVISLLSEQREIQEMGGTMRLGAYVCQLKPGTKAHVAYEKGKISERHRHRWEFNNKYLAPMEEKGFTVSGTLDSGALCEIAELKDHPWMLSVQFHPEFKSKPTDPHPLFLAFVRAAIQSSKKQHTHAQ
jgi:CTP synthase